MSKNLLIIIITVFGISQIASSTSMALQSGPPSSFESKLLAQGIGTSLEDLSKALSSTDQSTKIAAASVLARRYKVAAPSVLNQAMNTEADSKVKIWFAGLLIGLNQASGEQELTTICTSKATPAKLRADAVTQLSFRSKGSQCVPALLADLNDVKGVEADGIIASLGRVYSVSTAEQQLAIESSIRERLSGPTVDERVSAGRALITIRSPHASADLLTALAKEKDPVVAATLKQQLDVLSLGGH